MDMRRPFLLVLALPLAGCAGDAGDDAGAAGPAAWDLVPDVRIGSVDGPGALSRVADAAVAPDGRVHVLLPQEQRVAIFAPSGDSVGSVGRQGEGPGELVFPRSLGFLGDTLWVDDARQRRISLYGPGGAHLDDVPHPGVEGLSDDLSVTFGSPAAGGRALLSTAAGFGSPLGGSDHPFPILSVPRDGGAADTLAARYTAHDRAMFMTGTPDNITSVEVFVQVFSDGTLWSADPTGRWIAVVDRRVAEAGGQATYGLTRVGLDGDTAFSVRVPYEPVPVDPARVDSLLAGYSRSERSESELREILFLPDVLPPVSRLVVGRDGRIWVGREDREEAPLAWDVFDASGTLVARTGTPPGFRVHAATEDVVWGVETDELDVPYVVGYRIVEGAGDGG